MSDDILSSYMDRTIYDDSVFHIARLSKANNYPNNVHERRYRLKEVGRKDDSEKPRYDLLEFGPIAELVDVYTMGARKYKDKNWQKVKNFRNRYFAAALRHITAWRGGELTDPESGLPHLAHAIWNLVTLRWYERKHHLKGSLVKSQRKSGVQLQLRSSATEKKKIRRSCETPTRQYSEGFVTPPKESLPDLIGKVPHLLTNYGATTPIGGRSFLPINYRCVFDGGCPFQYVDYCMRFEQCKFKKRIKKAQTK